MDSEEYEFKTSLPIQLDATCKGFQHLALLSNENNLFKELNLSKSIKASDPNDFYNYIVLRVNSKVKDHIANTESGDELLSYERLS